MTAVKAGVKGYWRVYWRNPLTADDGRATVCFAGTVARVIIKPSRDIESLPLAHLHCNNRSAVQVSLGDFVRRRMGATQSARQALGRACRDLEGLFESLPVLSLSKGWRRVLREKT